MGRPHSHPGKPTGVKWEHQHCHHPTPNGDGSPSAQPTASPDREVRGWAGETTDEVPSQLNGRWVRASTPLPPGT